MIRASIHGNLGTDGELRYTAGGTAVLNLSVASNEWWIGSDGVENEDTTLVKVQIYGKSAEHLAQKARKGTAFVGFNLLYKVDETEKGDDIRKYHYFTTVGGSKVFIHPKEEMEGAAFEKTSTNTTEEHGKDAPMNSDDPETVVVPF